MRLQLSFEAKNVKKPALLQNPNPYIILRSRDTEENIGCTETVFDDANPHWCGTIIIDNAGECHNFLDLIIYNNSNEDDLKKYHDMSEAPIMPDSDSMEGMPPPGDQILSEILIDIGPLKDHLAESGSHGFLKEEYPLTNAGGVIWVRGHLSTESDEGMDLHFRALGVKNVEKGWLGLGRTDPYIEIFKKHFDPMASITADWQTVYRSSYITDHLNPMWHKTYISLENLCDGDLDKSLVVKLYDYNKNTANEYIGEVETTAAELKLHKAIRGNADRKRAFEMKKPRHNQDDFKPVGLLVVLEAK
jgi:hypothetical protein